MADITIYVGNKNYSSWSMRAWLPLRRTGADFEEVVIPLDVESSRALKQQHCPAGRVPVLRHGDLTVWDSLAIAEYLAEQFPDARLWPEDRAARAVARSACSEMHSGFAELRTHMPMNCRASRPGAGRTDGVAADIKRILALWRECRQRFGAGGAFLFGEYGLADMFFAPVVSRLRTYGVEVDETARGYCAAVLAQPHVQEWMAAAAAEPWKMAKYDG